MSERERSGLQIAASMLMEGDRQRDQDVIHFWCERAGWFGYEGSTIWRTSLNPASINDLAEAARGWYRENKDEDVEISDEYLSTEWFFGGPLAFLRAAREVVE